ncbi:hypothetical protein CPB84DRAFT_1686359, partial [Gymnopilus junonius]
LFDKGSMKEAMSTAAFERRKHRLGKLAPLSLQLCMANSSIVKSAGRWEGEIEVEGISTLGSVEVFDSGGTWDFLFGKTLLTAFKAVHDYNTDEITLKGANGCVIIQNQVQLLEDEKHTNQTDQSSKVAPICVITEDEQPFEGEESIVEINIEPSKDDTLFTCQTQPFKPEHINEILQLITIGTDLGKKEHSTVCQLISDFADIFALSVHEVLPVKDAVHQLNISLDATFSKKVHQKPLTPPQ